MSGKIRPLFTMMVGLSLVLAGSLAACGSGGGSAAPPSTAIKCVNSADCAGGSTCDPIKKVCVTKTFTSDIAIVGDTSVDAGGGTDATGTPDKDTVTPPQDTAVTPGDDKSCGECKVDSDCGGDFQCIPLLNGSFCAKKCAADGECKSGYKCEKASSGADAQKNCVLPTFSCNGCAVTGCEAGKKCNLKVDPPTCDAVKGQCEECLQDKDCDTGFACTKMGPSKICAPSCDGGKTCPDKSSCQTFVVGQVCAFQAATCCYGASCQVACAGCDPSKCLGGVCVECAKDGDCKAPATCVVNTHTCTTVSTCPADKPIKVSATGACVECTQDPHCGASPNGPTCNPATNTCGKTTVPGDCQNCIGTAYPDCVEVNGALSCVECKTDQTCADKGKGTCAASSYTCSGTIGIGNDGPPVKPSTKCSSDADCGTLKCDTKAGICKCQADADCQNGPDTAFTLMCDKPTGTCYSTDGKCDNVVAFCAADAGSVCKFGADIFGGLGGAGGGLPGIPGGGTGTNPLGNTGSCTCGAPASTGGTTTGGMTADCKNAPTTAMLLPNCTDAVCQADPKAAECSLAGIINCCQGGSGGTGSPLDMLGCLAKMQGGGGGTPDPACFGGACNDANCLTAIFQGGGGSGSASSGSCAASPF